MLLSSYFLRKDFFLITLSLSYYAFICFVIFLFLSFFPPFGFICRFYSICLYVFAYFFLAFFSLLPPSCSFYICMSLYMCVCEFLSAPYFSFYFSEHISTIVFGFLRKKKRIKRPKNNEHHCATYTRTQQTHPTWPTKKT